MKRQTNSGFTLIELLVVVSIIMILAGLTMSLFKFANVKAATDRTRAEVAALGLALEAYKIDNGDYPREDSTDSLDPQTNGNAVPSSSGSDAYKAASLVMYKELSGDNDCDGKGGDRDTANNNEKRRIYFEFKAGLLYPRVAAGTARPANSVRGLMDPFRNIYGYSTAGSAQTSGSSSGNSTKGFNPTFDLWSTADSDGTKTTADEKTRKTWITNW